LEHMSDHTYAWAGMLVLITLSALTLAYLWAAARSRSRQRPWSAWRTMSWLSGAALVAVASAPPLTTLAHHDPRVHMLQHLLLGMFAPLGLVLAAPLTLTLRTLPVAAARRVTRLLRSWPLRWLSHPLSGLALNIGALYVLYLTPLYALSLHSPLLHLALAIHFLAAGCLFTWAIVGPDPVPHRPSRAVRLVTLFSSIAAHATLAKLLYAYGWPHVVSTDPAQLAAAAQLMYYGGDLAELLLASALFASWCLPLRRDRRAALHPS
jgi:putative membrane protein